MQDSNREVINDSNAIRLLINIYMIKKVKSFNKPLNQEKFVDNVCKEFRNRRYNYPRKTILITWKQLLDKYKYCKEKMKRDEAVNSWKYFDLMDNCFDELKQTSQKFKDSKWTFLLIESLSKYQPLVLKEGLTMDILQIVEDDFRKAKNYDVNQKDIYNQWIFLKRFYRQNKKTAYYTHLTRNHSYFTALKQFFEPEEGNNYSSAGNLSESELISTEKSIDKGEIRKIKRQKTDAKIVPTLKDINRPTEKFEYSTTPFTVAMHYILLQCFKKYKSDLQNFNREIKEHILIDALGEFLKLGHNVTKQSIINEWNGLSCRYDLIKNTEHPDEWPYYNDMHWFYNDEGVTEQVKLPDNESTTGSIIVEDLRRRNLNSDHYTVLTERLLNVYEANNKECLEIQDILVERNLLREETNYLLTLFVEKFNK